METGDLILFAGSNLAARVVEVASHGPYSHSSMIFRRPGDGELLLWEEVSFTTGQDEINHRRHKGAQLGHALRLVNEYVEQDNAVFYRRLRWNRPADLDQRAMKIMSELDRTPWGTPLQMAGDWLEGHFLEHDSGRAHMFCSMLIATTYQSIGLLGDEHPPNYYSPSNFAPGPAEVALLDDAYLEKPIELILG